MTIERTHRRRSHIGFLRTTGAHRRSGATDLILATALAFVAGAINAGGFVAIGQYTEGEAEITISGQPHLLQGGEMILVPTNQPHAIKALKRFKMMLTKV